MTDDKKVEEKAVVTIEKDKVVVSAGQSVIATNDFTLVAPNGRRHKISKGDVISDAGAISLALKQKAPVKVNSPAPVVAAVATVAK